MTQGCQTPNKSPIESVPRSKLNTAASVRGPRSITVMAVKVTSVDRVKRCTLIYWTSSISTWQFIQGSLIDMKTLLIIRTRLLKCIVNNVILQSVPTAENTNNTNWWISGQHIKTNYCSSKIVYTTHMLFWMNLTLTCHVMSWHLIRKWTNLKLLWCPCRRDWTIPWIMFKVK